MICKSVEAFVSLQLRIWAHIKIPVYSLIGNTINLPSSISVNVIMTAG